MRRRAGFADSERERIKMKFTYKTQGTCSREIVFDYDGEKVTNVRFMGGCNGNLQAVSKLTDGKTPDEIAALIGGIRCGFKSTSCPDQLARAVTEAKRKFDAEHQ